LAEAAGRPGFHPRFAGVASDAFLSWLLRVENAPLMRERPVIQLNDGPRRSSRKSCERLTAAARKGHEWEMVPRMSRAVARGGPARKKQASGEGFCFSTVGGEGARSSAGVSAVSGYPSAEREPAGGPARIMQTLAQQRRAEAHKPMIHRGLWRWAGTEHKNSLLGVSVVERGDDVGRWLRWAGVVRSRLARELGGTRDRGGLSLRREGERRTPTDTGRW
jgi:hypothetical protein